MSDKLKCLNFCSRGVLESLIPLQLILDDPKQNPMNQTIERLRNPLPEDMTGVSSPRMNLLFQSFRLRNLNRPITGGEENLIRRANLELQFEQGRREYNYAAPSRLSSMYLVKNDQAGRGILSGMFAGRFEQPRVIEVNILNQLELINCDHNWLNQYYENQEEVFIQNYWTGIPFEGEGSWEYLLEGTIQVTNPEDAEYIESHCRIELPLEYDAILKDRAQRSNTTIDNA